MVKQVRIESIVPRKGQKYYIVSMRQKCFFVWRSWKYVERERNPDEDYAYRINGRWCDLKMRFKDLEVAQNVGNHLLSTPRTELVWSNES